MTGKRLTILACLTALLVSWSSAQAGVRIGLGINFPICFGPCCPRPAYVPAPVYVAPPPVYVMPAQPVYVQPPPVVYQAAPVAPAVRPAVTAPVAP
jgi:hypothetical protein